MGLYGFEADPRPMTLAILQLWAWFSSRASDVAGPALGVPPRPRV